MAVRPCGTVAGYSRHRRNKEQPCQPCRDARNAYKRAYKANGPENPRQGMKPDCIDCGRTMRPWNTRVEDHPGTARGTTELCARCQARRARAGQPSKRIRRPDNCIHCGRMLYTHGNPKPHPDAIQHSGKGACISCYKAGRPAKVKQPTPTQCVDCDSPLRPSSSTEEQYPGTRVHSGKSLCRTCYNHRWRNGGKPAAPKPEPVTIVDPGLEILMRGRREREARRARLARINQNRRTAA